MKSMRHTQNTQKHEAHFVFGVLETEDMDPSLKERERATTRLRQMKKALLTSMTCSWISLPMTFLETSNRLHSFII
jgi:hypothetical protein